MDMVAGDAAVTRPRRAAVAFLLVLVAGVAVTAEPGVDEPTSVKQSECYTCHFEGGAGLGPVLKEMFRVRAAEPLQIAPGQEAELRMEIVNWWTAELSGFEARIDISEAPSFAFTAPPAPVLDRSQAGVLPFVLGEVTAAERSDRSTFQVPAGGTELRVRLQPERTDGDQAPDLELRVWPPGSDPDADPPQVHDAGGAGGVEVHRVQASPVADGTWTVEAAQAGVTADLAADQSKLVDQPYTVAWDLWYNYTEDDPVRFGSSDAVLDGQQPETPQSTVIAWPLVLREPVTAPQAIRVDVTANAHYDHAPQFRATDDWLFTHNTTLVITPPPPPAPTGNASVPDNLTVTLGDPVAPDEAPDLQVKATVPLERWGEVIGYGAGFLLVVSLLSGGAFGDWSRRLQQWVLFRRGRRRVAFHNLVSYGLLAAAIAHLVVFLVESRFPWTVGMLLGGASLAGMLLAGLTGALQKPMVRAIGHGPWRWMHYLSFVLAFAGAVGHVALDGIHFVEFQEAVGWEDPARPWLESLLPSDPPVQE